ncbi:hypothetical protein BASA60_006995 [Batrachochytrium salamandrivorans]|nr:hypothetical protein BASA60_006995 [Batrachochytrium salamandrivorans]
MAPATSLQFLELPGSNGFIHGLYGLEACAIRGLIRVQHNPLKPLRIKRLWLSLRGLLWTRFLDTVVTFDMVRREKVLFEEHIDLLQDAEIDLDELSALGGMLDVPFEIAWPLHEPLTSGHGPSNQLLPPSCAIFGQSGSLHHYQAQVEYTLAASLIESTLSRSVSGTLSQEPKSNDTEVVGRDAPMSGLRLGLTSSLSVAAASLGLGSFFAIPTRTCVLPLSPFCVYDARMLPAIMHPDPRRWRSSPGMVPIEYDIEVGPIVLGPNDPIRFAYRMIVDNESARQGVRVSKVSFILKETHILGEDRCCMLDDQQQYYAVHRPPARVKGVTELLRWEHTEYNPTKQTRSASTSKSGAGPPQHPSSSSLGGTSSAPWSSSSTYLQPPQQAQGGRSDESTTFELLPLREPQKSMEVMSRPGTRDGAGDGIYVENEYTLHVPSLGGFTPSTAKPVIPTDDYICRKPNPRDAILQVRHSVLVTIDFVGAERISIESGAYLLSVGHDECARVLDEHPEILPPLDYDKIVGVEIWVPEYSVKDPDLVDTSAVDAEEMSVSESSLSNSRYHSDTTSHHESQDTASTIDTAPHALVEPPRNIPDSPTPRYEDVVNAPPPSRAYTPTDSLSSLDRSESRSCSNIDMSLELPKLLHSMDLEYAHQCSHPIESQRQHIDDEMVCEEAHRSDLNKSIGKAAATTTVASSPMLDPLSQFASEPISIAPLEEALEEAMHTRLELHIRLPTCHDRAARYSQPRSYNHIYRGNDNGNSRDSDHHDDDPSSHPPFPTDVNGIDHVQCDPVRSNGRLRGMSSQSPS